MLRPQTWYLLLAAVCTVVCALAGGGVVRLVMLVLAALTAVGAIFLFANRRRQALVCVLPMLLLVAWYVLLAVDTTSQADLRWQHALPAVAIVLTFLARKGIVHDERVVRAYDRIR